MARKIYKRKKLITELANELLIWLSLTLLSSMMILFILGVSTMPDASKSLSIGITGAGIGIGVLTFIFNIWMFKSELIFVYFMFKVLSTLFLTLMITITVLVGYMNLFDSSVIFNEKLWVIINIISALVLIPLWIVNVSSLKQPLSNIVAKSNHVSTHTNNEVLKVTNNANDDFLKEIR